MIFYLHYILLTSGLSGTSVLLGVFFKTYSDASQGEIGVLLMSLPFVSIVVKPLFCSMADRSQKYKLYLILALTIMSVGWSPFVLVPYLPTFYLNYPRAAWYLLVVACHIGNGGLGVAWSLGDSLAVNQSLRQGTPYSRMRLMGTVSWGFYGYIIGQINEVPYFPKFVPAFLLLQASLVIEIALLLCWNNDDFTMYDPNQQAHQVVTNGQQTLRRADQDLKQLDSLPCSLSGTLRLSSKAALAFRDIMAEDDLRAALKKLDAASRDLQVEEQTPGEEKGGASQQVASQQTVMTQSSNLSTTKSIGLHNQFNNTKISAMDCEKCAVKKTESEKNGKNPQTIIFKMILAEDGRLIKYLILYTLCGFLLAPLNFVFLSLDDLCKEKGCNFSHLAGSVLVSQAAIETVSFLVAPWMLAQMSRSAALVTGLAILTLRYCFYGTYYYTADISPYWALLGEWGHGIAYGIFCTNMADIALMFARESRLFIPEMRHLGFLSLPTKGSAHDNAMSDKEIEEKIRAEENSIKMALRATMQAVFGGFMDGLGIGTGSLVCGVVAEAYSYIKLWQLFAFLTLATCLGHQLVEVTRSKWSDTYRPKKGTKAYEIMSLSDESTTNNPTEKTEKFEPVQQLGEKEKHSVAC